MPRLRHVVTEVEVTVSDETAARLGNEWVKASEPSPKEEPKRRAPVSAKK